MKLKIFTPKRCQKIRKHSISMLVAIGTIMSMTLPAFAAGSINPGNFISTATTVLKSIVILIGAGLAVWGVVNLIEGYGNDNPGAKSQGMKQCMAGIGLILCGMVLIPVLGNMMSQAV